MIGKRTAVDDVSGKLSALATIVCSCVVPLVLVVSPASAAAAGMVLAWPMWLLICARRPVTAVALLTAVVVLNAHVLALLYQWGLDADVVRLLIPVKDLLAWSLLVVLAIQALVRRWQRSQALMWLMGYVAVAVGHLLILGSPAPLSTQLGSLRGAFVPLLALGVVALLTRAQRVAATVRCVGIVTAAALYGLVEQLLLPRSYLLEFIGVGSYWSEVKRVGGELEPLTNLPGNFFTEGGFPRLVGTFGDPLTSGTIIGSALVLAVAHRRNLRHPGPIFVLLSLALLLTFTRNGWLIAGIGIFATSVRQLGPMRTVARGTLALWGVAIVTTALPPLRNYVTTVLSGGDSSTLAHQQALSRISTLKFDAFGSGWGTGGSFAGNSFSESVSSESAFVALLAQVGIVGSLILLLLLVRLCVTAIRHMPSPSHGVWVLASLAIASVFSENVLAFNAGWFPFLTVGLVAAAPATAPAQVESAGHAATKSGEPALSGMPGAAFSKELPQGARLGLPPDGSRPATVR